MSTRLETEQTVGLNAGVLRDSLCQCEGETEKCHTFIDICLST